MNQPLWVIFSDRFIHVSVILINLLSTSWSHININSMLKTLIITSVTSLWTLMSACASVGWWTSWFRGAILPLMPTIILIVTNKTLSSIKKTTKWLVINIKYYVIFYFIISIKLSIHMFRCFIIRSILKICIAANLFTRFCYLRGVPCSLPKRFLYRVIATVRPKIMKYPLNNFIPIIKRIYSKA